ncbi:glyoxalase [Fibrivirga algicola]|uniref:glyoxalase n=1 Tax=Fibrivirga algicola TaxID=2950420 RepID=UPI001E4E798F|nr:glyoxalase [Fibrivirga algicola]
MRDTALLALRPEIATESTTSNPAETFQNQTLRPLLKLQNELLLALFRHYLVKRKQLGPDARFAKMGQTEQETYIEHTIQTDQKFRNLLVGVIVGQFTSEEWTLFLADEAELTRRLGNMLIQRIQSQRQQLVRGE